MKLALFFLFFSVASHARPVVLLSHFDTFGKAPFNNSTKVALLFAEKFKNHPEFELKLCNLNTVFDKSFYQLEDCLNALPEAPKLILGLGESNCNFKMEIMGRNLDKTKGPDNEGNERLNTPVIPGAPKEIGFTYPLPQMYCALPEADRKEAEVSNNAGTFVCNNLAYQFAQRYEDLTFGFIHVPANNCRNLDAKNVTALRNLESMITAAVKVDTFSRLPTKKKELDMLRSDKSDKCLNEFYKRAKGADEKGFWSILN
jgi:pyroglutamyl-peptidase